VAAVMPVLAATQTPERSSIENCSDLSIFSKRRSEFSLVELFSGNPFPGE